jgi:tetratricopeptide (TPR) repeat protein
MKELPKEETGELEKEVESNLKAVLGKASHSELNALLSSFVYASDQKRLLETLHTYRELAKAKPNEHLPDLALTLNALGELYRQGQQRNQAVRAYAKALGIYRTLAKTNPEAYEQDFIHTRDALDKLHFQA